MGLVQTWESFFQQHGLHTAQVLLVHDDLSNRRRYLNARSTLRTLIGLGVVPVVNENDTVATDEIRFGDNDTLGALVANLIDADVLLLLTDQPGLFSRDPREDPDAPLVNEAVADDPALDAMAGGGGLLGRGGMITKVRAARLAARSGAHTVIVGGRTDDVILRIAAGEQLGTWLRAGQSTLAARKQWLAGQLKAKGQLIIDGGAVKVLTHSGKICCNS
jgi:glutamate 5-kinase